jgi:hypothetical protein
VNQGLYLCIGGAIDGKHVALNDNPPPLIHQVPVTSEPPLSVVAKGVEEPYPVVTYKRESLHASGNEYFVYVCADSKEKDVIERLIDGYRAEGARK